MKLAVVVAVCFAVQGTVRDALAKLNQHEWHVEVSWLIAAGALYGLAWLPMAWFWGRVLAVLGQPTHWFDMLYAYTIGHLGKYVPGKALVLVIRIGMLKQRVISIRLGVASVLLETLTLMSVGAVLAAVLSLFVMRDDARFTIAAMITALVVGLPTIPPITRRLVRRLTAQRIASDDEDESSVDESSDDDQSVIEHQITTRLLAKGWLSAVLCWIVLGWSMWATLRAIGVTNVHPIADLPLLVAVVSLSIVAGFISMLPGGMVVRDALVFELLTSVCGEADALVAAILWRLVSLLAELVICGILEVAKRSRGSLRDHGPPATD